jgi:hypothetical protein
VLTLVRSVCVPALSMLVAISRRSYDIWGRHGSDCEHYCIFGCGIVYSVSYQRFRGSGYVCLQGKEVYIILHASEIKGSIVVAMKLHQ